MKILKASIRKLDETNAKTVILFTCVVLNEYDGEDLEISKT